jgi:hypothetical protein
VLERGCEEAEWRGERDDDRRARAWSGEGKRRGGGRLGAAWGAGEERRGRGRGAVPHEPTRHERGGSGPLEHRRAVHVARAPWARCEQGRRLARATRAQQVTCEA